MNKKQIEVKILGLNELGVKEINEYYKDNIQVGYFGKFKSDDLGKRKKRIKQINGFGPETVLHRVDIHQHIIGKKYGGGTGFEVKIKHVNCKIYEVEVVETFKEISLEV